ncbi:MAG: hypothetical protein ACJ72H_17860 [Candidatus Sulfotelmatobacter sp.]
MKLKHLEKFKPPSDARTQRPEIQPETQDQNSTAKIAFKRAEKPSRFLVEEGRYEAICVTVHDPHWDKRWRKWQVRFEFELCGMTTPPLTQFVNCGKDEAAPGIDGWLLQTMNAVGAESPCELRCRDFYVYAKTVVCDRKGRALPRHEWYSVVSRSSLITSEQDLVEAEADDEAACA